VKAAVVSVLVLAASAAAPAQQPPAPTFASAVETVYVDAFVTHRGQPVTGLQARDFELRDNGVLQRVELMGADTMPLTAVLVFDTSGSVAGEKLKALRAAGTAFMDALRAEDEVGLLTFSHEIRWQARPGRAREPVLQALAALRAEGASAVFDGLYAGLTITVSRGRGLVVLFSDGVDNLGWLDAEQVQRVAERSNSVVHVVGLRSDAARASRISPRPEGPHVRALRELAESTGGRYWEAEDAARLRAAFTAVARAMSTRYVLGYAPSSVPRVGWHRVDLRRRGHGGTGHARRGYWVAPARARP
jgi:VWFA-related protein